MKTIRAVLSNVCGGIGCLRELLSYGLEFLLAMCRPQAALAARLLAVESQLAGHTRRLQQKQGSRPRFTVAFRFLWVVLSKPWGGSPCPTHVIAERRGPRHTALYGEIAPRGQPSRTKALPSVDLTA